MWAIIAPTQYYKSSQQGTDENLTQEEWEALYDIDDIRAIARYVNRQTEKPPTQLEFSNLFGTYRLSRYANVFANQNGSPITGALQPTIVRFPKDPTCEHLIVEHGCSSIGVKECQSFHYLEHTDEQRRPFHPVRHEHKEG